MPMSDKVLRAINKGRRKAGLKPIRRKGTTKGEVRKTKTSRKAYEFSARDEKMFDRGWKKGYAIAKKELSS